MGRLGYRIHHLFLCVIILLSYGFPQAQEARAGQPVAQEAGAQPPVGQMNDIHDIKPLIDIGSEYRPLYWAVFFFILALVILAVIYALRKRKTRPGIETGEHISPEEAAYRSLDELAEFGDPDIREYYFQLSLILRIYVRQRYGINAPEMTTEEFLPHIKGLGSGEKIKQAFKTFLLFADPVKFAGRTADPVRMGEDMAFAREFVRQTTLDADNSNPDSENGPLVSK